MSMKYHINPATGTPTICRAKERPCPYGGKSGKDNHYNTYSEAHIASQDMMESKHMLLPSSGFLQKRKKAKIDKEIAKEYSKLTWDGEEDMYRDHEDIEYEIRTTDDQELIMSVIEGKAYIEEDWGMISLALQNPNLPREFINQVLERPHDYHVETQRWLMLNKALTHEDVIFVAEKHEDLYSRTIALKHESLKREYAVDFLESRSDELHELPWRSMIDNASVNKEDQTLFHDFRVRCGINGIFLGGGLDSIMIDEKYRDWMVGYDSSK